MQTFRGNQHPLLIPLNAVLVTVAPCSRAPQQGSSRKVVRIILKLSHHHRHDDDDPRSNLLSYKGLILRLALGAQAPTTHFRTYLLAYLTNSLLAALTVAVSFYVPSECYSC